MPSEPGLAVLAAVVMVTAGLAVPAGAAVAAPGDAGPGHAAGVRPVGKPQHVGRQAGIPLPMTRDSRTVRHANGRYTTTIYPGPVNYRTAQGWRQIDSSLVPTGTAGFAWRNKANRWTSSFARRAGSGYLRMQVAGQVFDFDAVGAASAAGETRGSHLSYPGAWPGADLVYDVSAGAVGETIVLHDSSAPASYDFAVRARGGRAPLTARRLADGSWEVFRAPAGGPVFVLQAPLAADAAQAAPGIPPSPGRPHASMTVRGHGSWLWRSGYLWTASGCPRLVGSSRSGSTRRSRSSLAPRTRVSPPTAGTAPRITGTGCCWAPTTPTCGGRRCSST